MIWQEWCLVITAVFMAAEIGFSFGKHNMLKIIREIHSLNDEKVKEAKP